MVVYHLKRNRIFFHRLLDEHMDAWELRNPGKRMFVVNKILQYDETKIKRIDHDSDSKKLEMIKTIKIKKTKSTHTKTNNGIIREVHHPTKKYPFETINQITKMSIETKIEESYEVESMPSTTDIHYSIESFDHPPDASIDILTLQHDGFIKHTTLVNMPTTKSILYNYDNPKVDTVTEDVLDMIMNSKSVAVTLNTKTKPNTREMGTQTDNDIKTMESWTMTELQIPTSLMKKDFDDVSEQRLIKYPKYSIRGGVIKIHEHHLDPDYESDDEKLFTMADVYTDDDGDDLDDDDYG
jgi:hypothetical protein